MAEIVGSIITAATGIKSFVDFVKKWQNDKKIRAVDCAFLDAQLERLDGVYVNAVEFSNHAGKIEPYMVKPERATSLRNILLANLDAVVKYVLAFRKINTTKPDRNQTTSQNVSEAIVRRIAKDLNVLLNNIEQSIVAVSAHLDVNKPLPDTRGPSEEGDVNPVFQTNIAKQAGDLNASLKTLDSLTADNFSLDERE